MKALATVLVLFGAFASACAVPQNNKNLLVALPPNVVGSPSVIPSTPLLRPCESTLSEGKITKVGFYKIIY